jgi:hypothetical protein
MTDDPHDREMSDPRSGNPVEHHNPLIVVPARQLSKQAPGCVVGPQGIGNWRSWEKLLDKPRWHGILRSTSTEKITL